MEFDIICRQGPILAVKAINLIAPGHSFIVQRSVLTMYGPKISARDRINRGPTNVVKVVAHGDHENKVSYQLERSLLCFSLSCNLLHTRGGFFYQPSG